VANLSLALTESATLLPDHTAIRLDSVEMTFSALDEASGRLAMFLLERGVQTGDRVGIMLPNVPEFAVAYYGVLKAGGVVVPMNPLLKAQEVQYYLSDSGARRIFAWHDFAGEAIEGAGGAGSEVDVVSPGALQALTGGLTPMTEAIPRDPSDTAIILYTSGTTGRPKGAELTHANLSRNARVATSTLFELGPSDVILGCLPFFHAFGQTCCLNTGILMGATVSLMARFDPAHALEIISRDGVTVFEGVPTMYSALLEKLGAADTSSLRLCVSGGAAMPVELLRNFEAAFGCAVLEGYGLSETSPVASFNHPRRERKPGSIGTPIEGVEFRLVDDEGHDVPAGETGEIVIRGHNVMKGYWRKPEETAAAFTSDGWFRTGDVATVDGDGYYYIVDRKKDLIIRGGFNVYPREVEEVLYQHPAVMEVAVVGIPDKSLGEEVGAAVALKAGQAATPEELRDFVKSRLAAYKYPRSVWITDGLPKGPTGKILRRMVRPPAPEDAR
jgi:long-chain acyl-CoA synthetase